MTFTIRIPGWLYRLIVRVWVHSMSIRIAFYIIPVYLKYARIWGYTNLWTDSELKRRIRERLRIKAREKKSPMIRLVSMRLFAENNEKELRMIDSFKRN